MTQQKGQWLCYVPPKSGPPRETAHLRIFCGMSRPVADLRGAKALHRAHVEYPRTAREKGKQGMVAVAVTFDESRTANDASVVSGRWSHGQGQCLRGSYFPQPHRSWALYASVSGRIQRHLNHKTQCSSGRRDSECRIGESRFGAFESPQPPPSRLPRGSRNPRLLLQSIENRELCRVGERGSEPPTPLSRIRSWQLICWFFVFLICLYPAHFVSSEKPYTELFTWPI